MGIDIELLSSKYQIGRHNMRNLVIRKWVTSSKNPPSRWRVYSYHGNSLKSFIAGINELVAQSYALDAPNLCEALEKGQLEQVRLLGEIEKQLGKLLEQST